MQAEGVGISTVAVLGSGDQVINPPKPGSGVTRGCMTLNVMVDGLNN